MNKNDEFIRKGDVMIMMQKSIDEIEKMLYQDNVNYETRNRVARIIRRNFGDEQSTKLTFRGVRNRYGKNFCSIKSGGIVENEVLDVRTREDNEVQSTVDFLNGKFRNSIKTGAIEILIKDIK